MSTRHLPAEISHLEAERQQIEVLIANAASAYDTAVLRNRYTQLSAMIDRFFSNQAPQQQAA